MQSPISAAARPKPSLRKTFTSRLFPSLQVLPLLLGVSCSQNATNTPADTHDASVGQMSPADGGPTTPESESLPSTTDETGSGGRPSSSSAHSTNASTNLSTDRTTTGRPSDSNTASPPPDPSGTSADSSTLPDSGTSETADTSTSTSTDAPEPGSGPSIRDGKLFVDGAPFRIRGVNWNPVPVGATHPQGLDYPGSVVEDAP